MAFRRPKCLKDILVHSELKTPVNDKGCVKCTDKRCRVCDCLVEGTRFSGPADTGENTFLSTIISQTSSGHLRARKYNF